MVLLEWPDRAAGFLPPDRLDIAFTLAPKLGPEASATREVTGYGAFAPRAERIRGDPPLPRSERLRRGRARSASRATPRPASYERLDSDEPALHPDELAAPAGRPAGARRQALQRDRASRRGRGAVRRDGERPARARLLGAADLRGRARRGAADPRGSRHRAGRGDRRSAGADRGALRGRGRCAGRAARASRCPARCRSRPASTIACRPTTSTRS